MASSPWGPGPLRERRLLEGHANACHLSAEWSTFENNVHRENLGDVSHLLGLGINQGPRTSPTGFFSRQCNRAPRCRIPPSRLCPLLQRSICRGLSVSHSWEARHTTQKVQWFKDSRAELFMSSARARSTCFCISRSVRPHASRALRPPSSIASLDASPLPRT